VEAALERIPGAGFAITSDVEGGLVLGERLALDAGGRPFRLGDDLKPLYHSAAVFASNYLVTVTAIAHELERAAGIEDPASILAPLQEATLANIHRVGPAEALTGPAVRGDAPTVARNLEALAGRMPEAVAPYVALADLALELAARSGRLDERARAAVGEVLARWR
jgi:predicted short-subunit dehydrogenase-like oxidoreductase (DUF2520 family)